MHHRVSQGQAHEFLAGKYGAVEELRPLAGGFWSSAYSFSHAGLALVVRFGALEAWFEAGRAALAFASPDLPVPEVLEVGAAFGRAYAISVRCYGINLEDVRPDQSDTAGLTRRRSAPRRPTAPGAPQRIRQSHSATELAASGQFLITAATQIPMTVKTASGWRWGRR